MANNVRKWYMQKADYDDVVVASKVSLARNLSEYDFCDRLSNDSAQKLIEQVRALTCEIAGREGIEYYSCNVQRLGDVEKNLLVESSSLTPGMIGGKHPSGLILSEDESISIMINDEDHICIQAAQAGANLKAAYAAAGRIDDFMDSRLHYAYSDRYGYLTASLTKVGTGLKATYTLSLPALAMAEKIRPLTEEVAKFGITISGTPGEDSKNSGFLYRISNQKTMGITEREILENLDQIAGQIIALERKQRTTFIESAHDEIEDKVYRSYGVLKYTKEITQSSAMMLLAQIKLGSDWGLLPIYGNGADIYRLMVEIQPASLQSRAKRLLKQKECDRERAVYLNKSLPRLLGSE